MSLYEYLTINAKHLLEYWDNDLNLIDIKELPQDYTGIIHWKCSEGHKWVLPLDKAISKDFCCIQCYWDNIKKTKERNRKKRNYLERQLNRYKKSH